ncbi:endonuclease/exonuclease/phosphatase family protein [Pseudoalteromonas ruthenica]|uniref:endonuclease/exonuclease/phosphatase family protein n=1 Tax=Pseudoalteromonas ruthenica TaxID=151081 RepID=UPI001109D914|nr:endonuclease/exonuclease/phosphatase family protein [Pseudoalteromonas ruthenica]TLX49409.1 endonuclease/exonuclease/phosphatase family protein [Pseudoalteromonas ruthenica]
MTLCKRFGLIGSLCLFVAACAQPHSSVPTTLRIATFNVSMDGSNYVTNPSELSESPLPALLAQGQHPQIHNIAHIIQRVRPDVILLNEFDYNEDWREQVDAFQRHYLGKDHGSVKAIHYPYSYSAPVNTGVTSDYDFDGNGELSGNGGDAYGFGFYPGQYGMVILSRYPIDHERVRTFAQLKWAQQPQAQMPMLDGNAFYDNRTWQAARLSSKSFWDVPISVDGKRVHLLASHPTPPVFDGPEDRNGLRNKAEIKLIADYLDNQSDYLVDDQGRQGGLNDNSRFVILGDLNAAPQGDKARPEAINQVLAHDKVDASMVPESTGGAGVDEQAYARYYTASWRARADYVLPSKFGFEPISAGVYWPTEQNPAQYKLISDRKASSDHRLVWMDLKLIKKQ